jgi:spore coat polysaccharide biosynthesis predicted glycosyltransferase SpsG
MLRREFAAPAAPPPSPIAGRILVTFGGGDDRGAVLKTLKALLPALPGDVRFVVVSGAHNPRNAEIAGWIEAHGARQAQLHVGPAEVAPLMSSCSLAVMAGGGTTYEANFCGLPMLLIAIADNQVSHSKAWQDAGAARYLGRLEDVGPQALLSEVLKALGAAGKSTPAPGARRLVDGLGRTRVARIMLESLAA